jgi:hypothetical protein
MRCEIAPHLAHGEGPRKSREIGRKIASAPAVRRGDPLPAFVDPQFALL